MGRQSSSVWVRKLKVCYIHSSTAYIAVSVWCNRKPSDAVNLSNEEALHLYRDALDKADPLFDEPGLSLITFKIKYWMDRYLSCDGHQTIYILKYFWILLHACNSTYRLTDTFFPKSEPPPLVLLVNYFSMVRPHVSCLLFYGNEFLKDMVGWSTKKGSLPGPI